MGKRSDFKRIARDAYDTPPEAIAPLLPHLAPHTVYIEPCAGKGHLIRALRAAGHICSEAYDIEPPALSGSSLSVAKQDALVYIPQARIKAEVFITNPPWSRDILHPLITHLINLRPAWLLFDAAWPFTKQSAPYTPYLRKVVAIGRVRWIPGTTMTGKDDCAWYLFDRQPGPPPIFYGRT